MALGSERLGTILQYFKNHHLYSKKGKYTQQRKTHSPKTMCENYYYSMTITPNPNNIPMR